MSKPRVVIQHHARDYVPWLHGLYGWDESTVKPDSIWLCCHVGNRGCDPLFAIDVRVPCWPWLERLLGDRLW